MPFRWISGRHFLLNYRMKNDLVYLLVGAVFPTTILFSQSECGYKKTVSIDEEIVFLFKETPSFKQAVYLIEYDDMPDFHAKSIMNEDADNVLISFNFREVIKESKRVVVSILNFWKKNDLLS